MSNQTAKRGLSVKDLVTIGIFTALMLVFSMVGGIFFAPNPVLTFYMPVGSAILCGPIYLLLIAKVKKRFAITIVGALIGIIWFVTGMHWAFALGTILMGIVADLDRDERTTHQISHLRGSPQGKYDNCGCFPGKIEPECFGCAEVH